jgi:hypothetical protein
MFEYEIKRFSRRCCKTEREFQPGDVYYSALLEEGDQFQRLDFSPEAWTGPPAEAIGWWRCRVPDRDPNRVYWAPAAVLLEYFGRLAENPEKQELAYLMGLSLARKRLVQIVDDPSWPNTANRLVVHVPRTNRDYRIAVSSSPPERLRQLQTELCEQLFTDQPIDPLDIEPAPATDSD